jgi:hypothetical protein
MIDCRRFKRANRSTEPEKQFALIGLRTSVSQVVQQDVSRLVAKWQTESVVGFRLDDPQGTVPPVQILQFQMH